jgi:diguanylate cyclase (GGDEF)-like protein/PAS domain S-box-containing protein
MALLTGQNVAGRKLLWLLALAPPLPLAIDLLEKFVDEARRFGTANLTPAFTVIDTVLLVALIWIFGAQLQRIDARRAIEQAKRREVETRLALFVEHAPAAIAMFDCDMHYVAVSRRWLSDYGLSIEDIRGRTHYELFPDVPDRWRDIHRRCLSGAVEKSEKDRLERHDGKAEDWVRWEIRPWYTAVSEVGGIILFSEVITERVHAEERVRRLNRVYAVLSGINSLIVRVRDSQALFDEACRISVESGDFGVGWIALYHRDSGELIPTASSGLSVDNSLLRPLVISAGGEQEYSVPGRAVNSGDIVFENDLQTSPMKANPRYTAIMDLGYRAVIALPLIVDDFTTGCFSMWSKKENVFDDEELRLLQEISNDISFALQYLTKQEELDYVSYYDVLTGLPNRTLFLDRISQELRGNHGVSTSLALLVMDVERFSIVNETLGRHGGDELLRSLAQRLKTACGDEPKLARVGANVFAIGLLEARNPAEVAHHIERTFLDACRAPFTVHGTEIRISAKIGAAYYPSDGRNSDELFRNAEAALKKAKHSKEKYLFYSSDMNAQAAKTLSLETRLRKAVESNEFVLFYQPKINLNTSAMSGLEALIRWDNPEIGLVAPSDFIPILEETGLIVEVGLWALGRAMGDYTSWATKGYTVPRIAVNVSAIQLRRDDFVPQVMALVQGAGVKPEALELEITESLIMHDVERSNRALSVLRGAGIHVSMDDFGTGYSSLSYLASLPVDKIKIDRSFIAGMTENALDRKVVSTIISLAHSFGFPVVAEGVETVEQAQALHDLNCDEAQGFLFSRPLPSDEVIAMFDAPRSASTNH